MAAAGSGPSDVMHQYGARNLPGASSFRRILPSALTLLKSAAFMEYRREDLELLRPDAINHHNGNWDSIYKSMGTAKPEYDLWLDKYSHILEDSKDTPVIDLGCGYGNDTLYLHERGYETISCDISKEALKRLHYFIENPVVRQFDMLHGMPFEDNSTKIIIADLSIHYFLWADTMKIVEELKRVLMGGGYLLCRVNSTMDLQHIACSRIKIEDNYYDFGRRKKRYFDKEILERLFANWLLCSINEYSLERHGSQKILWEVAVRKGVRI